MIQYYHNKFPILKDMINTLYKYCSSGGCCHIVTDESNLYDEDIEFVIEYAQRDENKNEIDSELSVAICNILHEMTFTQRAIFFHSLNFEYDYHNKETFDNLFKKIYASDELILAIQAEFDYDERFKTGGD